MIRARFQANEDDYRPIFWPIKYPYWCTGYGPNYATIVAYADSKDEILENWPEAENIEIKEVTEITFTDRFPCPEWYDDGDD